LFFIPEDLGDQFEFSELNSHKVQNFSLFGVQRFTFLSNEDIIEKMNFSIYEGSLEAQLSQVGFHGVRELLESIDSFIQDNSLGRNVSSLSKLIDLEFFKELKDLFFLSIGKENTTFSSDLFRKLESKGLEAVFFSSTEGDLHDLVLSDAELGVSEFGLDSSERNGGHVFMTEDKDVVKFINKTSDLFDPDSLIVLWLLLGLGQVDNLCSLRYLSETFKINLTKTLLSFLALWIKIPLLITPSTVTCELSRISLYIPSPLLKL